MHGFWTSIFRSEQQLRTARFDQLRTEFVANWPADRDPAGRAECAKVLAPGNRPVPYWSELFAAEAQLIQHLSADPLRLKHAGLKDEYAVTVGATMAATYFARLSDPKTCTEDQFRTEAIDMLAQIQRMRVSRYAFNRMRTLLTFVATLFAITFCWLIVSYWGTVTPSQQAAASHLPFALTTLVLMGMLGGCVSAVSRLYSIAWTGETALALDDLNHTSWGLALNLVTSTLEGGIFAMVLYAIFAGGLVEGALFPRFNETKVNTPFFHEFMEKGLATHGDLAKALVWAFIAGFSERLVPDFLRTFETRLTAPGAAAAAAK